MHLLKTIFPCAIALLLATFGVAEDLAPRLGGMVRSAHHAAAERGTPAPESPGGPTTDLIEPFLARISGKTARSVSNATSEGGTPTPEYHGVPTKPLIDPFLACTSGERAPSVADAAVAVDDSTPSPENHRRPAGKLIDPLAPVSEKTVRSVPDAVADAWTLAPESHRRLAGKLIDPLAPVIEKTARTAPDAVADATPLPPENSRGLAGKPIEPLARMGEETAHPVPEVPTAGNSRDWRAQREPTAKRIDLHVARTSGEIAHEAPNSVPGDSTRSSSNPARLAQKRTDPYLDGISETYPLALGVTTPSGTPVAHSPGGLSTTFIDPNCAAQIGPYFDATVEALLWRLESTRGQPMILNPVLGRTIRTDDLDLGFQAGPRINMAFMSDEEESIHAFEVGYFGVYNWFDRIVEQAPAGSFLRLPDRLGDVGVTTDFSAAEQMQASYGVNLNSVELNVVFGGPRSDFHWMLGPRFIRLEERFNLDSFTAGRFSFYEIGTRNDLWGVQWAGRWRRTRGCWELTGICKVGIYDNQARQSTLLTDNDRTVVLREFSPGATVAAFVLDAGVTAAYQFNGTWLARVGYNVFVMDNVARAPDQLDFSNNTTSGNRLFFRQDAIAHGLNFGLEARW